MRRQSGNVTVLIVLQSVGAVLLVLMALDVFSILYTRRAAQTAADSAAMGAVRAIQPMIGRFLYEATSRKVDYLFAQAAQEYGYALTMWQQSAAQTDAACADGATDAEGSFDAEAADGCISAWHGANPPPDKVAIQRRWLDGHVASAAVVDALMGHDVDITVEDLVTGVLTAEEQACVLLDHSGAAQAAGMDEAAKYARLNGATAVTVQVPYDNRPRVLVRVQRPIPTVYLQRFSSEPFRAQGEASATIGLLADERVVLGASDCRALPWW